MNPVTRALQTIAAIQSETREPMRAEAANRGSGAPLIAQVNATRSQAAFARDREIRIDKRDRVMVAPARDVPRHGVTIIVGALLLALALCLGWIGRWNLDSFSIKPASVEKVSSSADPFDASAKSKRLTVQGSSTNTNATPSTRAHASSKRGAQTSESPPAVERTKVSTKPAPVPETKPTTIEGWTLLEVKDGAVVLEGPNGVWRATRGDTVPDVGTIDSIVRWGSRWIVATSRGLISTR